MDWIIVGILIVGFIIYRFRADMKKDEKILNKIQLDLHFNKLVETLNYAAFNGKGEITFIDKREFNLYQDGQNKIINFLYSTGILTITWKYKYLQQEVVHTRKINDAVNLSKQDQEEVAQRFVNEMNIIINNHQKKIKSNI